MKHPDEELKEAARRMGEQEDAAVYEAAQARRFAAQRGGALTQPEAQAEGPSPKAVPPVPNEQLNVRQTANQLGVHENTVRNLEKRGLLQAARLPGSGVRRFRKEDVDRMRHEMFSQFAPATTIDEAIASGQVRDNRPPNEQEGLERWTFGLLRDGPLPTSHEQGEWVKFSDAASTLSALQERLEEAEAERDQLLDPRNSLSDVLNARRQMQVERDKALRQVEALREAATAMQSAIYAEHHSHQLGARRKLREASRVLDEVLTQIEVTESHTG